MRSGKHQRLHLNEPDQPPAPMEHTPSKVTQSSPLLERSASADEHVEHCPPRLMAVGMVIIVVVALGFGLSMPSDLKGRGSETVRYLSSTIGWTYFGAWSVSFYPQLYLNWSRKSVVGLSLDFELYNLVGFGCYSVFNCAFAYDPGVQEAYRAANDGKDNLVQANDVFFALHAFAITALTVVQCAIYDRGGQVLSRLAKISMTGVIVLSAIYFFVVRGVNDGSGVWSTLTWLYWLSYVKLMISVVKYMPQVAMNYRRKSTSGWNIYNVLLDFTGGSLSIAQLILDASVEDDWSGVSGDPVKLGLGFASMFFDIIFMVQHYGMYNPKRRQGAAAAVGGGGAPRADSASLSLDIAADTPQARRFNPISVSSVSDVIAVKEQQAAPSMATAQEEGGRGEVVPRLSSSVE
jgi:cystinosin